MDNSRNSAASQYAANTVDYSSNSHVFDDPTFYQMTEKWKALFDRGLIWDYMSNRNQGGMYHESDTLMLYSESPLNAVNNSAWRDGHNTPSGCSRKATGSSLPSSPVMNWSFPSLPRIRSWPFNGLHTTWTPVKQKY